MKQSPRSTEITVCNGFQIGLHPYPGLPDIMVLLTIGPRGGILSQCQLDRLHVLTLIKALQNWVEGESLPQHPEHQLNEEDE